MSDVQLALDKLCYFRIKKNKYYSNLLNDNNNNNNNNNNNDNNNVMYVNRHVMIEIKNNLFVILLLLQVFCMKTFLNI